jgi:SH3-like domain-containing protein
MNLNSGRIVGFRNIFLCLTFFLTGCNNSDLISLNNDIDGISAEIVPDKRTGICDIRAEKRPGGRIILFGNSTEPKAGSFIINTLGNKYKNLVDSINILPDTVVNKKFHGLASLSVINLRKGPDHRSEMVSQALMGTPLLILQEKDSWLLVQTPDKYIAWTEESSVSAMTSAEMNRWKRSERYIFKNTSGQIYCSPSDTCIISDIVSGSIVGKKEIKGNYIEITLPDGRVGYIQKDNLMSFDEFCNESNPDGATVLKSAALFAGIPYLWGGTSSKGFDCSGMVQEAFFLNGLLLPRDASQQALCGIPVDISGGFENLRIGDLLFFGSVKDSEMRITHVALYKGNSEFIHCSGMVMLTSLDSSAKNFSGYRRKTLLKASRINGAAKGTVMIRNHPWYRFI